MKTHFLAALLRPFGTSASTTGFPQNISTEVCWLLRPNQGHPNLQPIDEHDWASLLETAKKGMRRE
jgi:hypothetical protein